MVRAPSPKAPQASAEAEHSPSDSVAGSAAELVAEARAVSAAIRTRLRWLEDGGAGGVPKGKQQPPRRAPAAPARQEAPTKSARLDEVPGEVPGEIPDEIIEHATPVILPPKAEPRRAPAPLSPPPARSPAVAEAVYPELPDLQTLRGAEGLTTVRRVLGDCRRCKLCHGRNNIVFGDGTADTWLAFVGEGPGADEDRLGKPFVGAAGQLLDRMIDAMAAEARKRGQEELANHLGRQLVYICNVVKCRPPGNRTPEPDEVAACTPFLRGQLHSLRPSLRAIVALGRTPTQYLLGTTAAISSLRGRFTAWEGIPVMPTYHPAYLLRTPSAKRQVWEDLQMVLEALSTPPPLR